MTRLRRCDPTQRRDETERRWCSRCRRSGTSSAFARCYPGLIDAGLNVVVLTDERFRDAVESCGASFVDLFGRYPLDGVDPESTPPPVRFVSYAGLYAREIITDAAALTPALVVNNTFAVIGRVVASALGIPFVNVCAGHDRRPGARGRRVSPRSTAQRLGGLPRGDRVAPRARARRRDGALVGGRASART